MTETTNKPSVCVYCGSSSRGPDSHREAAQALGRAMANAGMRLVFGGGRVGIMGAISDAVMEAGGEAIGIIPTFLQAREVGHTGLTRLEVVETMHERKARMAELSDAFLVLPGGLGTLEELFEVMTWRQLALHDKPILIVDVDGYWAGLRAVLDDVIATGYAPAQASRLITFVDSVDAAMEILSATPAGDSTLATDRL